MRSLLLRAKEYVQALGMEGAVTAILIIVALAVSVFEFLGGGQVSGPVLVAVLSMLLWGLLSLRVHAARTDEKILEQLKTLEARVHSFTTAVPFGIQLHDRNDYASAQAYLAGANDVAIRGGSLLGFISGNRGIIETMAADGCRFRILLLDPDYYAGFTPSGSDRPRIEKRDIEQVVDQLQTIVRNARAKNPTATIELRYLSYPPPFSILMVDVKQPHGKIQVEMYLYYRTPAVKRPHFELTRASSPHWYEQFQGEFEDTWANAKEHAFTAN